WTGWLERVVCLLMLQGVVGSLTRSVLTVGPFTSRYL
ncbi:hypothetical protein A2U01_0079530, partial [Trifolium medium]|nr:hypothetical protein [Trifolium medium]